MIKFFKQALESIKLYLSKLSFRTGVIVLSSCVIFYILSFVSLALPISGVARGALWTIFFGMAKTAQYGGLVILGVEGVKRLREKFGRKG